MILTGLVLLLIAPENLSTAMLLFGVVFMMMFIGRVAAKKLLLLAGGLVLIVALGVGTVEMCIRDSRPATPPANIRRRKAEYSWSERTLFFKNDFAMDEHRL